MFPRPRPGAFGRALLALIPAFSTFPAAAAIPIQGGPSAVRVDAVRKEAVTNRRPVTGDLRAARRVAVATREKGLVRVLAVDEGSAVSPGDVLARLDVTQLELDRRVLRAQRPPAEASVAEREADVRRERSDLESVAKLVERTAANPKELVDAESALAAAEARLAASEAQLTVIDAQLAKLEQRIEDMTIRAPFAGTVVAVHTEVGSWAAEGSAAVELLSNELEVWLEVPQNLYAALADGSLPIDVRVGAGTTRFALKNYLAIPEVDVRGRAFKLVGSASSDLPLAAGMSVVAMVPTGEEREMLTVHRDAILRNQVGAYVYGVIPGGEGEPAKAAPMDVEVLFHTETRAVVRSSSLQPGMQVVTEGNERLHPMAPILPDSGGSGGPEPPPESDGDGFDRRQGEPDGSETTEDQDAPR